MTLINMDIVVMVLDSKHVHSYSDGMWGENVAIFGVDNSSSVHICNKRKYRYLSS